MSSILAALYQAIVNAWREVKVARATADAQTTQDAADRADAAVEHIRGEVAKSQ